MAARRWPPIADVDRDAADDAMAKWKAKGRPTARIYRRGEARELLKSCANQHRLILDGETLQLARARWLVYVWTSADGPEYVGKGRSLARVFDSRHHALSQVRPSDRIEILFCADAAEAAWLELVLIRGLRPRLNVCGKKRSHGPGARIETDSTGDGTESRGQYGVVRVGPGAYTYKRLMDVRGSSRK